MRTRAAAKASEEATSAVAPAPETSASTMEASPPTQQAPVAPKRKRGRQTPAQPLKGGWTLPHGMGAVFAAAPSAVAPEHSSAIETAPASATQATAPVAASPAAPVVANAPRKPAVKGTTTRQTRISLRVTKPLSNGSGKSEETTVKHEEVAREGGYPNKRARVTRSSTLKTAQTAASDVLPGDTQTLVKTEIAEAALDTAGVTLSVVSTRKVLIIKGITVKNNVAVKVEDKIVIDTSKILDPDYRAMVKRGIDNPYGLTPGYSPYSYRRVPSSEDCEEVYGILAELHGECKPPEKMPAASLEVAGCGEVPCVLDALLRTLVSGYTLMARANSAIQSLAKHYGVREQGTGKGSINWEKVRLSPQEELAGVIRIAGDGPKRARFIKTILDIVYEENVARLAAEGVNPAEENGTRDLLSLDHMHNMTRDEALAKFVTYPGIGIKTAACVTLFCLQIPCFAVDTHVQKFCRWLGWVPPKADPDNCFRHGDFMVPDHLKYGLHQLFIRHGQMCFKCRKATKPGTKDWNEAPECPLEHLLDRSKEEAGSAKPKSKAREEEFEEDE
ncbi:DNA glycosylase [Lasiosphaeria hispida]|uniref:DNA glycosylase n=1 Tax=Lasiosphaeria hispida TaxID=260671 RepID=A0AAJ0HVT8_9PEZI|nr:DNA glycosylase [Lasiosphaeria hispida]